LLRHGQLTFLGNPFVRLARMLDPIFKLAIVTLRKSRGYRVYTSRGVQTPRGMIIHNLTDAEFVAWHGLPVTVQNGAGQLKIAVHE
jgi:hypothetical protein